MILAEGGMKPGARINLLRLNDAAKYRPNVGNVNYICNFSLELNILVSSDLRKVFYILDKLFW